MAAMAAMLALLLFELLRPLINGAPPRAGVAFLGAQSAMLLGYTLWGGMKEVTAAVLLALGPLLAWMRSSRRDAAGPGSCPGLSRRPSSPCSVPRGAVWILLTMGPLVAEARLRLGTDRSLARWREGYHSLSPWSRPCPS